MMLFDTGSKYIVFSLALVSTIAFGFKLVHGQHEPLCARIERAINHDLNDTELFRNDAGSNGCNIEFTRPDLMIGIEVYESDRKSRERFDSTVRLFRTEQIDQKLTPAVKLGTYGIWNKAIFVPSTNRASHSLILRNERYVITLLSPDKDLLFKIEEVLRPLFKDEMQ